MRIKTWLLRLAIFVLVIWLAGSLYLRLNVNGVLFHNTQSYSVERPTRAMQTFIERDNGETVDVWEAANENKERYILYFHGRGGRQQEMVKRLQAYGTVIAPAYPGYSRSQGGPSVEGTKDMAVAVYDWLVEERGIAPERITVTGFSLGSSPALYLATKRADFQELIIIGGYSNLANMCTFAYGPFCLFAGDIFPNDTWAQQVRVPVRQFHVRDDNQVPVKEGRRLNKAFTKNVPFTLLEDYTHNFPKLRPIFTSTND
jgi:predicted esterase